MVLQVASAKRTLWYSLTGLQSVTLGLGDYHNVCYSNMQENEYSAYTGTVNAHFTL